MNNNGKSHGCLISVIVVLSLIVILVAAIFIIFFTDRSDMPDVEEFISEVESSERTTDNNISINDLIKIESETGGTSVINIVLTNADITALANDAIDSNKDIPIEDLLFNCNADETIDMTGVITDLSVLADNPDIPGLVKSLLGSANGKRIYATIFISYLGGDEFDISIESIKIENLNIPFVDAIFKPMTENITTMLKDQLKDSSNFDLQEFKIEEDQLRMSGTITD